MIKKSRTNNFQVIIALTILMMFGLMLSMLSSLNPFSKILPSVDSSVFLYVADVIDRGGLPYVDVFDHKGILLYFINYFGYALFGKLGIWMMEVFFLCTSILIAYMTARLFTGIWQSFFSVLSVFFALTFYFQQGNFTEEYALPFILIAVYIFSKYFIEGYVLKKLPCFFAGASMMMVLMLRPNMIGVWAVFVAFIFFHTIYLKKYDLLVRYIVFFSLGLIVAFLPFAIYLFVNGIFQEFVSSYLVFNFSYTGDVKESRLRLIYRFMVVDSVGSLSLVVSMLLATNKKTNKNLRCYAIASIIAILVSLATVVMAGRMYLHYAMVLLPCYVVPLALLYNYINDKFIKSFDKFFKKSISVCFMFGIFFMASFNEYYIGFITVNTVSDNPYINSAYLESEAKREVSLAIKENTDADDKIIVMGNACAVYLESERMAASRFAFPEVTSVYPKMADEFIEDIKMNNPKMIIIPSNIDDMPTHANDYIHELVEERYTQVYDGDKYKAFLLMDEVNR